MLMWGIICAICLIVEAIIPAMVSVWFALAALIMVGLSLFIFNFSIQLVVFAILSLIFILIFKPFCNNVFHTKDALPKEEVKVTKSLGKDGELFLYEVRYKGGIWSALAKEEYRDGESAFIDHFEGNKIVLERGGE